MNNFIKKHNRSFVLTVSLLSVSMIGIASFYVNKIDFSSFKTRVGIIPDFDLKKHAGNLMPVEGFSDKQIQAIKDIVLKTVKQQYANVDQPVVDGANDAALQETNARENLQSLAKVNSDAILKGGFILGNPKAKAKLVAFVDPLCPHSLKLIKGLSSKVGSDSNIGCHIVPFGIISRSSVQLSKMMITIAQKYPSKLLDFSKMVSEGSGEITKEKVTGILQSLEMDVKAINKSLSASDVQLTVENNAKIAKDIGISGVPTVFAIESDGNWVLVPPIDGKTFDQMIKDLKDSKKLQFALKE